MTHTNLSYNEALNLALTLTGCIVGIFSILIVYIIIYAENRAKKRKMDEFKRDVSESIKMMKK